MRLTYNKNCVVCHGSGWDDGCAVAHFHGIPPCTAKPCLACPPEHDPVNHPAHYKGASGIESIDVIEGFGLGFHLGNTVKYILRAGKKDPSKVVEDLEKARWYLDREIQRRKEP